jgi:Transposase DDE domain
MDTRTDPAPLAQGLRYLQRLRPLRDRLRADGTARDKAGNRRLFLDQYLGLLLVYFFSPALTSLRALQRATELPRVRRAAGGGRVALGSLSEAAAVFDPELLRAALTELAGSAPGGVPPGDRAALRALTAADGTVLKALPAMAWALWQGGRHRAAKLHLRFEVFRGVPVAARLTPAASGGPAQLAAALQPGRLYVADRGYADYSLLEAVHAAGSSDVARVQASAAYRAASERPLAEADRAAGVVWDRDLARLGTDRHRREVFHPVRLVLIRRPGAEAVYLATDRTDLSAELIGAAYRYRWSVGLFFRWLKCVPGCKHLLSRAEGGVAMQAYAALIASVPVCLWTGRKATKALYEVLCHYLSGWASLDDVPAHLRRTEPHEANSS